VSLGPVVAATVPPVTPPPLPGAGYLHRPPATGHRPPATGHRPPAPGHRPPAPGHRPPGTGHRPPAPGHRAPATGPRPPGTGHRPPATGHRPPAIGHPPRAAAVIAHRPPPPAAGHAPEPAPVATPRADSRGCKPLLSDSEGRGPPRPTSYGYDTTVDGTVDFPRRRRPRVVDDALVLPVAAERDHEQVVEAHPGAVRRREAVVLHDGRVDVVVAVAAQAPAFVAGHRLPDPVGRVALDRTVLDRGLVRSVVRLLVLEEDRAAVFACGRRSRAGAAGRSGTRPRHSRSTRRSSQGAWATASRSGPPSTSPGARRGSATWRARWPPV
jgi:hypothetical protein